MPTVIVVRLFLLFLRLILQLHTIKEEEEKKEEEEEEEFCGVRARVRKTGDKLD